MYFKDSDEADNNSPYTRKACAPHRGTQRQKGNERENKSALLFQFFQCSWAGNVAETWQPWLPHLHGQTKFKTSCQTVSRMAGCCRISPAYYGVTVKIHSIVAYSTWKSSVIGSRLYFLRGYVVINVVMPHQMYVHDPLMLSVYLALVGFVVYNCGSIMIYNRTIQCYPEETAFPFRVRFPSRLLLHVSSGSYSFPLSPLACSLEI